MLGTAQNCRNPIICVHEDRDSCLIGMKLTLLSVRDHCPTVSIVASCPAPPQSFVDWLSDNIPNVRLCSHPETKNRSWNAKAAVLLRLLREGYSEVIWLDSDVIVHHDVLSSLMGLQPATFGAAQETYFGQNQGGSIRTRAWGLTVGRQMPCTVNSGVLRITGEHVELLRAWDVLLKHPLYVRAQSLPWHDRPLHMIGDQEVLTALLGSRDYANVPLFLLRRGADIAQCMGPAGFTPLERIIAFYSGFPGLVHSMGSKPWMRKSLPPRIEFKLSSLRHYYEHLHMELTPYVCVARRYEARLNEHDLRWLRPTSMPAKFIEATLPSPILKEFPLALIDATSRWCRRWLRIARYALPEEFCLRQSPLS